MRIYIRNSVPDPLHPYPSLVPHHNTSYPSLQPLNLYPNPNPLFLPHCNQLTPLHPTTTRNLIPYSFQALFSLPPTPTPSPHNVYINTHLCKPLHAYKYVYMYSYIYKHTHTYMKLNVHTYLYTYTQIYIQLHTYTKICIDAYIHTKLHRHMYIYAYMHTLHTYKKKYTPVFRNDRDLPLTLPALPQPFYEGWRMVF